MSPQLEITVLVPSKYLPIVVVLMIFFFFCISSDLLIAKGRSHPSHKAGREMKVESYLFRRSLHLIEEIYGLEGWLTPHGCIASKWQSKDPESRSFGCSSQCCLLSTALSDQ